MKNLSVLIILFFSLTGCNNNNTKAPVGADGPSGTTAKVDSFFPVTSYIKGQLHEIDSLPVTPLRIITAGEKSDSFWIKREELKLYLQPFISNEINETNLTALFKESKFNDLTLNAITFSYDPAKSLPDSLLLQHWDVYVNPETNKVSKIYIVKKIANKKENTIQQFTWVADKWAKIVTIKNSQEGAKPIISEEKFIWAF